jgi:DNA-binding MarR family transcriptional regulator
MISIGKSIGSIYRHQSVLVSHLLKPLGLGSGQYLFLITIGEHPGISQKEISDLIHIDRANTNRALKKLEALGYIKIRANKDDRRNKESYVTEQGHIVLNELKQELKTVTHVLSDGMTDEEIELLNSLLLKMDTNIQKKCKQLKETTYE